MALTGGFKSAVGHSFRVLDGQLGKYQTRLMDIAVKIERLTTRQNIGPPAGSTAHLRFGPIKRNGRVFSDALRSFRN